MIIGMLFHPAHDFQVSVVSKYYEDLGYRVRKIEADFHKKPEHEYRNDFFTMHPTEDYILHIDSDEIILPNDMKTLVSSLLGDNVYRTSIIDYHEEMRVIDPLRPHKPIVAVKKGTKFFHNRNTEEFGKVLPISIHHLGYLPRIMDWKIQNYLKRNEIHELGNCALIRNSATASYDTPPEVLAVMEALT